MRSFLSKLSGWLYIRRPRLVCNSAIWDAGIRELKRRTHGSQRESGAFLLGRNKDDQKEILEFVYYDDIDQHALDTGIVKFAGNKLPKLWEHCRRRGFGVVADVHVHPAGYGQSSSDRADPVMPRAGHIAIIVPHFASAATRPGDNPEVGVVIVERLPIARPRSTGLPDRVEGGATSRRRQCRLSEGPNRKHDLSKACGARAKACATNKGCPLNSLFFDETFTQADRIGFNGRIAPRKCCFDCPDHQCPIELVQTR